MSNFVAGQILTASELNSAFAQNSTSFVNVNNFGAKGDGVADDTTAIQAAINTKQSVFLPQPSVYYKITSALDMRGNNGQWLLGASHLKTRINQFSNNTQILRAGGNQQRVSGLYLTCANQQASTNTSAIGLELTNAFNSTFEDLQIYTVVTGVGIDQSAAGGTNTVFSCVFSDIQVGNYSLRAVDMRTLGVVFSTGNVFQDIYTQNFRFDSSIGTCTRGIEFSQHSSTFLANINVEWTAPSADAILLQACLGASVHALHCEGVQISNFASSMLNVADDRSHVFVNGFDVISCTIGAGPVGIIQYFGNPSIVVRGLTDLLNTNNGTGFYAVYSQFGTTGEVVITESSFPDVNAESNVPATLIPVIKLVNLDWRHRTEGGKNILFGTAAPTSGTWAVGDKVYNTAPTAGGNEGFICTTAGTPGTWKTFGAIQA